MSASDKSPPVSPGAEHWHMQEDGQNNGPHGEPPFQYGVISRWWVRLLQPSGWDLPAPSATEPPDSETLSPTDVIDDFCALQEAFADCVQAAEGLDLRRIRVGSPALPLLRISLGAWFEAHLGHERRHLAQMRRTLDDVDRGRHDMSDRPEDGR